MRTDTSDARDTQPRMNGQSAREKDERHAHLQLCWYSFTGHCCIEKAQAKETTCGAYLARYTLFTARTYFGVQRIV